jgi:hypothetical protein
MWIRIDDWLIDVNVYTLFTIEPINYECNCLCGYTKDNERKVFRTSRDYKELRKVLDEIELCLVQNKGNEYKNKFPTATTTLFKDDKNEIKVHWIDNKEI